MNLDETLLFRYDSHALEQHFDLPVHTWIAELEVQGVELTPGELFEGV